MTKWKNIIFHLLLVHICTSGHKWVKDTCYTWCQISVKFIKVEFKGTMAVSNMHLQHFFRCTILARETDSGTGILCLVSTSLTVLEKCRGDWIGNQWLIPGSKCQGGCLITFFYTEQYSLCLTKLICLVLMSCWQRFFSRTFHNFLFGKECVAVYIVIPYSAYKRNPYHNDAPTYY